MTNRAFRETPSTASPGARTHPDDATGWAEYERGQAIEYDMPENEAGPSGTLAVVVGGALLAGFAVAAAVLQRRNR